ncbi:MAG: hypothetical protein JWP97_5429 [Labilithrix sp.]|nr:hypothetical protein [Labilithrix sp.]
MKGTARMKDDSERFDPKGTMDTLPPPHGESDAYSAATRVGTLPEHVLEAMRKQETDASLQRRTRSGMQKAAVMPRVQSPPQLAPPSPLTPLVIRADVPAESGLVAKAMTPQEGWLSAPPPAPASGAQPTAAARVSSRPATALHVPPAAPILPTLISVNPLAPRGSLVRSLLIVAVFAALGAVVAVALLTFLGR